MDQNLQAFVKRETCVFTSRNPTLSKADSKLISVLLFLDLKPIFLFLSQSANDVSLQRLFFPLWEAKKKIKKKKVFPLCPLNLRVATFSRKEKGGNCEGENSVKNAFSSGDKLFSALVSL